MNIYQELKARGFCYQQTDEEAIEKLLTTEQVRFYVGFDPTGCCRRRGIFRSFWSEVRPRRSATLRGGSRPGR